jgi:hypothetical protein
MEIDTLEYSWVKDIAVSVRLQIYLFALINTNNHLRTRGTKPRLEQRHELSLTGILPLLWERSPGREGRLTQRAASHFIVTMDMWRWI